MAKANSSRASDAPAALDVTFKLFADAKRVLAQNVDGKPIDIGTMEHEGKTFRVKLDVDPVDTQASPGVQSALEAAVSSLTFDYLDGLRALSRCENTPSYRPYELRALPHKAHHLRRCRVFAPHPFVWASSPRLVAVVNRVRILREVSFPPSHGKAAPA
jgi:hypothetical protein